MQRGGAQCQLTERERERKRGERAGAYAWAVGTRISHPHVYCAAGGHQKRQTINTGKGSIVDWSRDSCFTFNLFHFQHNPFLHASSPFCWKNRTWVLPRCSRALFGCVERAYVLACNRCCVHALTALRFIVAQTFLLERQARVSVHWFEERSGRFHGRYTRRVSLRALVAVFTQVVGGCRE